MRSLDVALVASDAAEAVSAAEADMQQCWGEPLGGVRERLKALSARLDRDLPPLQFGLRITTLVRDTTEQAWADAEAEAEAKVAEMAKSNGAGWNDHRGTVAVGQQRLLDLHKESDVLHDNLYTARRKFGGGAAGAT